VPTGFEAKTKVKTSKHPSLKDFIFYASHFLPIWPKPKFNIFVVCSPPIGDCDGKKVQVQVLGAGGNIKK
jgi:hypothetical protein